MSETLSRYAARGHGHDEMLRTSGAVRQAWHDLLDGADAGGLERLVTTTESAAELRRGEATPTTGTPWRPDPLPVLLSQEDWSPLETAALQRAELFDAILTDLYGERRLLSTGLLPPEVVVGHPGFLRAAAGIALPGDRQLTLAGIDVARNADGAWVVLDDRCDAPPAMGLAIENRHVLSQVLGDHYRASHVRRIGPFFRALSDQLHSLAPGAAGNPTVALLAPSRDVAGPQDDAAVAAQLGVRLVHTEDLVVLDSQLWARSLGAPERIDVLLRRVRGGECDPLELRARATGVPGLVHAARSGQLSIANPLGSGVLGNPALLTYLPRISRAVLDEELTLDSAVTYWCGERSMCSHVIANLGRLVLKPVRPGPRAAAIRGWELSIGEQAELAARIAAQPGRWVGQEPIQVSTTPTIAAGQLVAAPTGLRLFVTSTSEGYRLMPGGVGRVMRDEVATGPSPEAGTVKDVWVLGAGPTTAVAQVPRELPRRSERTGLAPRVARDLFRFGYCTERAERSVRLRRAIADVEHDDVETMAALRTAIGATVVGEDVPEATDASPPTELTRNIAELTRAAAGAREQISGDTWLVLASLHRALASYRTALNRSRAGATAALPRLLRPLLALSAVVTEGTVRDLGWALTMSGRRLARAEGLIASLTPAVTRRPDPEAAAAIDAAILTAHESSITHRRRYHDATALPGMLDLLLWDEANPRSLRFQLTDLRALLADVPVLDRGPQARDQLLHDVEDLLTELAGRDVLAHPDPDGGYPQLVEVLGSIGWRLAELREEIDLVHFTAPTAARFGQGGQR